MLRCLWRYLMNDSKRSSKYWAGNAVLAIALAVLFFMGPLSNLMGIWAMALWVALAGFGFYLVTTDKSAPDNLD